MAPVQPHKADSGAARTSPGTSPKREIPSEGERERERDQNWRERKPGIGREPRRAPLRPHRRGGEAASVARLDGGRRGPPGRAMAAPPLSWADVDDALRAGADLEAFLPAECFRQPYPKSAADLRAPPASDASSDPDAQVRKPARSEKRVSNLC